jgi:hypothetical protein
MRGSATEQIDSQLAYPKKITIGRPAKSASVTVRPL